MSLTFKTPRVRREFCTCSIQPELLDILEFIEDFFGIIPVITSAYREGDEGVHGTDPLRGLDLRLRGLPGQTVAKMINENFIYDPTRPGKLCAIVHDIGLGAHLHLQVHPKTCKRSLA